ncbi:MAG: diphthine synthase [archaeon]
MIYLIGLGLNYDGISKQGLVAAKKCKKVYLENYTIDFPYPIEQLKEVIGKKIVVVNREFVESLEIVDEAKKKDVALLVYGSPLTATTHISLIEEAKNCRIKYKIIYNASVLDAVAETGLQLYKFGKISSMPKWDKEKKFTPESFMEIVKENNSIKAHSLILVDIGLNFHEAVKQLINASKNKIKLNEVIVCSRLGARNRRIFYDYIENLKNKKIEAPYCFIIPSKLHFVEKEFLESFK